MVTFLQRQHVVKRAVPPVRLRARNNGVRWRARGAEQRNAQHTALHWHGGAVLFRHGLAPQKQERRRQSIVAAGQGGWSTLRAGRAEFRFRVSGAFSAVRSLLQSPWLVLGLIVTLSALLLVPSIAITGIPLPQSRPVLPPPPDLDQELYRILVPEKAQNKTAKAPSDLLSSMRIVQYRPQAGDTISSIAQRFKLKLDTVISWNGIRDARSIRVGTPLEIPNSDGLRYIVRRGDTLERIARSSRIELNEVLDWNRLASSVITVGQELFLPGARMNANDLNGVLGSLFIWPVRGKISSFFGNRPDPFTGIVGFHAGIDIANVRGTPIMAAAAGTVREAGFNSLFGRYVILNHSGYQTMYSHLDRSLVSRGGKVRQGQKIAELGSTGYSTGPHLDFRIFRNGEAVDPLRLLK